jgi:CRP/FNR family transcriptional regulator, cyclic AMP receptor protein
MLPTVEKVLLLSNAAFFAELPGEVLAEMCAAFEEIEVASGETVFAKGDFGSSMYVVAAGAVRVHDGNLEIAVLREREVFGELAALDPELRSATVTVLEDAMLLRLEHETLLELMSDHVALAKSVVRFLCRRYR